MIAVLHAHRDEADKALALVKAQFTRNDPPVDDKTIFDYLVKNAPAGRPAAEGGNLADGERLASAVFEHRYEDSYVAHAPMEPHPPWLRGERKVTSGPVRRRRSR
jgi:hypothetical protein